MNNNNSSKQILLSVLGVAILVVAVVGVSFAAFSYSQEGKAVNEITTGSITMTYSNPQNGINISNAMPMTDEQGKALKDTNQYFDFSVSTNIVGTATINYAITATKEQESTLADNAVKVYLTSGAITTEEATEEKEPTLISALSTTSGSELSGAPEGQYILKSGTVSAGENTTQYRLRMWVADNYVVTGTAKTFKLRVNVYGKAA